MTEKEPIRKEKKPGDSFADKTLEELFSKNPKYNQYFHILYLPQNESEPTEVPDDFLPDFVLFVIRESTDVYSIALNNETNQERLVDEAKKRLGLAEKILQPDKFSDLEIVQGAIDILTVNDKFRAGGIQTMAAIVHGKNKKNKEYFFLHFPKTEVLENGALIAIQYLKGVEPKKKKVN